VCRRSVLELLKDNITLSFVETCRKALPLSSSVSSDIPHIGQAIGRTHFFRPFFSATFFDHFFQPLFS
jgi:hypothetical protein